MTTNNHTPIAVGAAANAATFNSPMAELDEAIKLHNWSASSAPTVNDDASAGYSVGSWWYYNGTMYHCYNATIGAADWRMPTIIGEIKMWATDTAPSGWLLCYGQAISRSTYSALFSVISTTFGAGDGSTTFNLPDFRGRMPLGQDDMGGSSANRVTHAQADYIGGASGAQTHTLTTNQMPAHTHTITQEGPTTTTNSASAGTRLDPAVWNRPTSSAGGGGAHNNMPPYLTINFIIYTGV